MPVVKFKKLSKEDNIDIIKWTFFDESDSLPLKENTIKLFPELKKIDESKMSKEEINSYIEKLVGKYYDENENLIMEEINRYNNIWTPYNDKYFNSLCKYFNINWLKERETIIAEVGIIPVSPRYLDDYTFSTSTNIDSKNIIEIIAHEILHFAWFIKWRELYPETKRVELDTPYLPWQYSEMVVDAILNSPEIKKVFQGKIDGRAYDSFYNITYNGENAMEHLKLIYNKNISIEDKIKEGYEYLCDHQQRR